MVAARPPVRKMKMRLRMVLAVGLMLALASAGCAHGTDDSAGVATAQSGAPAASSSPTSAAGHDEATALKFSQCMRQHGMTWFPDPQTDGRLTITLPKGVTPEKLKVAQEACKQYAPGGPSDGKADPKAVEQARKVAQCMRENGVPNFPDPDPNGGITIDKNKLGTGPGDPTFDKADAACSKFRPSPPPGSGGTGKSDGGTQQPGRDGGLGA
jgi:hypothetical protein